MTIPHEHEAVRSFTAMLRRSAPAEAVAFAEFNDQSVGREDGAIPRKYRELIALGVALTTQCQYCLASHAAALKKLGATHEEIAETTFIASALRAGAAYTHGLVAMRYFDEAGAAEGNEQPEAQSVEASA
jgi:AhpD family alkylhydroperoxidase